MAIAPRVRFEVFKRHNFTCQYCGRSSPEVILEVDHIVPKAEGGTDDILNLTTSCWECNRGKSKIPLDRIKTSSEPLEAAIELSERLRQLEEYNFALAEDDARREEDTWRLITHWQNAVHGPSVDNQPRTIAPQNYYWLKSALRTCPREQIREFMDKAIARGFTRDFRWVGGCVRNWKAQQEAANAPNS